MSNEKALLRTNIHQQLLNVVKQWKILYLGYILREVQIYPSKKHSHRKDREKRRTQTTLMIPQHEIAQHSVPETGTCHYSDVQKRVRFALCDKTYVHLHVRVYSIIR